MSDTSPISIASVSGILGVVLYGAVGLLYLVSGLLVPIPWLIPLWVLWFAGVLLLVRLFRTQRVATPLLALALALIWLAYITFGDAVLGWTA